MSRPSSDENPSRARDHLANERTYLAWLRVGAAVMVLGLAVAEFGGSGIFAVAAGGLLVVVGATGVIYGTVRYRRVNREIERNTFVTGSRGGGPSAASVVLVVALLAAFVLLVLGYPDSAGGS